jgi:hypothetical protein
VPDAGARAAASCDPERGCETTRRPTARRATTATCTADDVCTAGGGGSAPPAERGRARHVAGAHPARDARERARFLNARHAPAPHVTAGDFHVVLRDTSGATLFAHDVPAAAFAVDGGRVVYRDDHRAEGGDFVLLELRARGERTVLSLRATMAGVDTAPGSETELEALRVARTLAARRSTGACARAPGA